MISIYNNYTVFSLQGIWMKQVGGRDIKDHVYRALSSIFSPDLQQKVNMTGNYNKEKLPTSIFDLLCGKCLTGVEIRIRQFETLCMYTYPYLL